MSYAHMDHARWVNAQIEAERARELKSRRKPGTKGWDVAPKQLNDFQARVFDIIGIVGRGIYNAPISWNAIDWRNYGRGIAIPWRGDMSTFDGNALTTLVLLCHEARIRVSVEPLSFRLIRLTFFPRVAKGGIGERHPNVDEAVADMRSWLPSFHHIHFRGGDPSGPATPLFVDEADKAA